MPCKAFGQQSGFAATNASSSSPRRRAFLLTSADLALFPRTLPHQCDP